MGEWATYQLSDLLLFSPRVYFRLFELLNRTSWPAQIVTLLAGAVILWLLLRPTVWRHRCILVLLGIIWCGVAGNYFWRHYATINWAATLIAPLFILQGVLLSALGLWGRKMVVVGGRGAAWLVAFAICTLAMLGYPLLAPLAGRPLVQAEVFGLAPDPTVLATLAVLTMTLAGFRLIALVIPVLWCGFSALTLWAMQAETFWFIAVAPVLFAALVILQVRNRQI